MKNVEWVEVQPFHQLGAFKWNAMKLGYKKASQYSDPDARSRQPGNRAVSCRGVPRPLAFPSEIQSIPAQESYHAGCRPPKSLATSAGARGVSRHWSRLPRRPNQYSAGLLALGSGLFLFVGLAIGAFAPKAQIAGPIGLTGLIMFLYGVGILYGREFFEGGRRSSGSKYATCWRWSRAPPGFCGAGAWRRCRRQDRARFWASTPAH